MITFLLFLVFQKDIPSFSSTQEMAPALLTSKQIQQHVKTTEEKKLEDKIIHVLTPFIGSQEQIVANISIDYDFSEQSTISEQYGPQKTLRSEEMSKERARGYSVSENAKEYEISKTISTTKVEFPKIKRLTAAVIVDSGGGALEPAQIEEMILLIKQSIGIDESRGDSVTVRSVEFRGDARPMAAKGWILFYGVVAFSLFLFLQWVLNTSARGDRVEIQSPNSEESFQQDEAEVSVLDESPVISSKNLPFDYLETMRAEEIVRLLETESPQICALILAHLEAGKVAEVLSLFSEVLRVEVAVRIARMGNVSLEIVEKVSDALDAKLSEFAQTLSDIGGVSKIANVFSYMDPQTAQVTLEHIEQFDSVLASSIKKCMVTFEELVELEDARLSELIYMADRADMLLALKGSSEELKERVYSLLSQGEREKFKEELRFLGAVKMREIEKAQNRIVELLQKSDKC